MLCSKGLGTHLSPRGLHTGNSGGKIQEGVSPEGPVPTNIWYIYYIFIIGWPFYLTGHFSMIRDGLHSTWEEETDNQNNR